MNYENELSYLEGKIKSIQDNNDLMKALKELKNISTHNDVETFLSNHKDFNIPDIDLTKEIETIKSKLAYSFVEYMILKDNS